MIEAYLRANKMFVDYNEVSLCIITKAATNSTSVGVMLYNTCLSLQCSLKWIEHTHLT